MTSPVGWALEVARGREPGRRFSLPAQACHLGNDLGGLAGIDLSGQEGNSPKRMSGLQAVVEPAGDGGIRLKDQESAGGTFINKQRVLAGRWQTLNEGDLIQLGGVQLRVVRSGGVEAEAKAAPRTTAAFALQVGEGLVCRTWDDVLRASAQRWEALKEELISGRLAAFAHQVGRADLAPDPLAGGTADEQLDAWLGRLPTTKPCGPELEVHPKSVVIETSAGEGAMVRKSVTVSNTGFRLLKVTASVEPAGDGWLALGRGGASQTINVVEQATIELVATVPAGGVEGAGKKAVMRLRSNGGEATVDVSLKRAAPVVSPSMRGSAEAGARGSGRGLRDWLSNQPVGVRLVRWPLALGVLRLLLAAGDAVVAPGASSAPGWAGGALVLAVVGGMAGWFAGKEAGVTAVDRAQGAFAGAFLGMVVATLAVAASRAIVAPVVGGSWAAQALIWGLAGLGLAGLSTWLVPDRSSAEGETA